MSDKQIRRISKIAGLAAAWDRSTKVEEAFRAGFRACAELGPRCDGEFPPHPWLEENEAWRNFTLGKENG